MQEQKPAPYGKCAHIPRVKFVNELSEDMAKNLVDSYDLPPLYESGMFERAFKSHYSMARNERMRCRWREYVQAIETRKFSPFELPDVRELHFYNCAIRFRPSESTKYHDHRHKLKPGPGVDNIGQMPIPQEALMKRGVVEKTVKNKSKKVVEKEKKNSKKS